MELFIPPSSEPAISLALALVASSKVPLILVDDAFRVVGASGTFSSAFGLDPKSVNGTDIARLGRGEWNVPQLKSLLKATFGGTATVDAYEMDLVRDGHDTACLVLNAHKLDYDDDQPLVALTVTDVTSARRSEKLKNDLIQEKQVLLQELQHRVANSLQIIASVLMQSARRVQSDETRLHLHDAHHRIMSIATLQKQLAIATADKVELRRYFKDLCASIGASMIDSEERISLVSTTDDSSADANMSVSLGLIITELVINSLKHAFPDRNQKGSINVDYRGEGAGFKLTVSDDGVGIIAGEGTGKPGLGTGIVDALAKQLGASVETANAKPGTKVSVFRA